MPNPLTYTDTDFTTSGGLVDPEQLREEFVAASFPSTPALFVAIDTSGIGATLLVKVHFDTVPDATDEATSDALIAAHTATGPTPPIEPIKTLTAGNNINLAGTAADPIVNVDDIIIGSGTNGLLDLRGQQGGSIGGSVNISGGFGLTTGGRINVKAGATNSTGENVLISGGDGPTGASGGVFISGGTSGDDDGVGGDVVLSGGQGGVVTGKGGDIDISAGDSEGSGQAPGNVSIGGGERIGFSERGAVTIQENGGNVGIGTSAPDPSALLDIDSTTQGLLPPRMTTTQRDAVSSPATGLGVFNTTTNQPEFFNGSVWQSGGGLGYTLTWGANLQTTGRYAQTNGITSGQQETGLSAGSEHIPVATGTLNCVTWNSGTADATTVFKIWKNGVVAHTFTATGLGGKEENIGLAVVVGVDRIAIEYDAGMRPAGCILVAYII